LALDPIEPAAFDFILQVEQVYASLMAGAAWRSGQEPDLGGRLIYAGKLDGECRALLAAGNIAGAASLAATADAAAQKLAIRDGVADFLVTSLDEALRILKNEIRKRAAVAVCVALAPEAVEREMLERGVLPDQLRPDAAAGPETAPFVLQGARKIKLFPPEESRALLTWRVAAAPARWMPKLDAIALDCLSLESSPAASAARRWLRLAPRYLGRLAQGVRVLYCEPEAARVFVMRLQLAVDRGEIGVEVRVSLSCNGETRALHLSPRAP
jgi:urocanate hydratase